MCQRHLKKTINIELLDLSLLTVASISTQTRGLLPSGALDAHPIKLSAPLGHHPNHQLLWAIIRIIGSFWVSSELSAPPGYHPNHRFLLGIIRIISSSWISPESSAPPGYHPNHRLLLDITQIIGSSWTSTSKSSIHLSMISSESSASCSWNSRTCTVFDSAFFTPYT